ncbi:hypothetical protein BD410DRAFT_900624 [Rickenella mellea]|uniref:Uncharacterized protein n=1 Tax=Rickenella mellea TaxID=50990 RepID=A0A4Y7PTX3_9AGAM|nr:hypothetical protein BD410DRAFT_900624 [Rickenella mellea]
MEIAVLSTSWNLVREIAEIVDRLDQTREDARSLKYLESQAITFLSIVTTGIAGLDLTPYRQTIVSLELLYRDILATSEEYIADGEIEKLKNAAGMRRDILKLNQRMKVYFNTYLLHGSIDTARLNLQAFVELPPPPPLMSTTSEKAMWKVMSWPIGATTGNRTFTNPPRVVSNLESPVFTPPSPMSTAPATRLDISNSSYAGSDSISRPSTPPSSVASPLILPPAYASLPPFSDSDTPSHRHSTDRVTQTVEEHSYTQLDRNLNHHQLHTPTSPTASHSRDHTRRPDPPMSRHTPQASHPSTYLSVVPCSSVFTSQIRMESVESQGNEEHRTPQPSTSNSASEHILPTQPSAMDTGRRISSALSENLTDPLHSSSRPRRPLPPTPASARIPTPRRPGFVLRLQALRDSDYIDESAIKYGWLIFKKGEILYTDGKKFNVVQGNKISHIVVNAQNSNGDCGLVDPAKRFSEGFFSISRPYMRYLS